MGDHLGVLSAGRAALLSGEVYREEPPVVGGTGRWGVSMILRPGRAMLDALTDLAREAAAVAGPGQWAHGPDLLHASLRALAVYEEVPDVTAYPEALAEAAAETGARAITATVRMVSPHPRGVAVFVHPHDDTLNRLYARLALALARRGLAGFEHWTRDVWYINFMHFAAEVDAAALVEWCDKRRELELGVTTFDAVDLVRYRYQGGMRADTLFRQPLTAELEPVEVDEVR